MQRWRSATAGDDEFHLGDRDLVAIAAFPVFEDLGKARIEFNQLAGAGAGDALAFAEDTGHVGRDEEERLAGLRAEAHVGDDLLLIAWQRGGWQHSLPRFRFARLLVAFGVIAAA